MTGSFAEKPPLLLVISCSLSLVKISAHQFSLSPGSAFRLSQLYLIPTFTFLVKNSEHEKADILDESNLLTNVNAAMTAKKSSSVSVKIQTLYVE